MFDLLFPSRPRPAAAMMDLARRKTGLTDFGPQPVEEALDQLQASCHAEANLSLFGRISTHWDNLRLLKNLLILRDRELADPAILERPIEQPIFVMGVPRSGTSFLHALLAEDEATLAPRCWQVIYPYPDHPAAGRGAGPRLVQRQFDFFNRLAPELRNLHPFDAETPQECTDITAHSFQSTRFEITYDVPSYRPWLSRKGHRDAYRFHRRFLQHLQGSAGGRWVLKSPDHVFAMEALREVYPDARIVFSHRDPLKVLPSLARLTEVLRRPFARRVDRAAIGRQITGDWAMGVEQMMMAQSARLWPADRVFHVRYREVTADPVGTIQRLYDHFGMELTPRYRDRLVNRVVGNPDGGYGRNVYRFETFGLNAGEERERYRSYMRHFDVEEEVAVS
ncbi:MAG: sulfotransferase [Caulobacteraceae bacterium]|nr:sulfotransferase [Caulobacteraceae bacterium]